jgi:hypothetical protein
VSELQILESVQEAIELLNRHQRQLSNGSEEIFAKVFHAKKHLDREVRQILADPTF